MNIFRLPKQAERREQWISIIETHQTVDRRIKTINVCCLHFTDDDYTKKGHLKKSALPTIFMQLV